MPRWDPRTARWDAIKEPFTRLYQTERRPLKEVREILESEHGFKASLRSFKTKITLWKLEKNTKAAATKFIAHKTSKRLAVGKKSSFRVGGRKVSQTQLARYRREWQTVKDESFSDSSPEPPSDVECYTPTEGARTPIALPRESHESSSGTKKESVDYFSSPRRPSKQLQTPAETPLSPSLSLPGPLRSMELILSATQEYHLPLFQFGVENEQLTQLRQQQPEWNLRRFYTMANSISGHMNAREYKQVQDVYSQTLDRIEPVLRDKNPILMTAILQICCRFYQDKQAPLVQPLLKLVAGMAEKVFWKGHPLHRLCTALIDSPECFVDLITFSLREAIRMLQTNLGPQHALTIGATRGLHTALVSQGNFRGALDAISPVAVMPQGSLYLELDTLHRMVVCLITLEDFDEADVVLEKIAKMLKCLTSKYHQDPAAFLYFQEKGELLRLRRDPMSMVMLMRAVELTKTSPELNHRLPWTQKHLNYARLTLMSEDPMVPVYRNWMPRW